MIYEDYFKSVVGGNFTSPEYYNTTYDNKNYEPILVNTVPNSDYLDADILELYPDIYKVVMPMIDKMLIGKNTSDVNDSNLRVWTLEIYDALEADDDIKKENKVYESETTNAKPIDNRTNNLNQTVSNINPIKNNNYIQTSNPVNRTNVVNKKEDIKENKTLEVASRYGNRNNPLLRDFIRIMILNRLFGNNNNNRPQRPPYPNFGRPNFNSMPNYRPTNANPYSQYLKNKPKTYFDTPYPEED